MNVFTFILNTPEELLSLADCITVDGDVEGKIDFFFKGLEKFIFFKGLKVC